MGLDVYLYQYIDKEKADALEAEYEKLSEQIWKEVTGGVAYDQLTEEQKQQASSKTEELRDKMGLGEWGEAPESLKKKIQEPSTIKPDHLFGIGYFRSSYNEGGINRVAEVATGKYGLYWIFDREQDDEYSFQPDWQKARARAQQLIDEMEANAKKTGGPLFVMDCMANMFDDLATVAQRCSSKNDALQIYQGEYERCEDGDGPFGGGGYSNIRGEFYHKTPIEVVGVVHGARKGILAGALEPATYLVCRQSDETLQFYADALRIVIETCDYVMAQEKPKQYWLHWSA